MIDLVKISRSKHFHIGRRGFMEVWFTPADWHIVDINLNISGWIRLELSVLCIGISMGYMTRKRPPQL